MDIANTTNRETGTKRPAKGLRRACWECKRRNVQKGSSKTSISPHSSVDSLEPERADQTNACSLHIGERLNKLENFFEKFAGRKSFAIATPSDSPSNPMSGECSKKQSGQGLPEIAKDVRSISSFGDGTRSAQTWTSSPSIRTLVDEQDSAHLSTNDTIRRTLVALLPSQHDADIIFESSNGWMILDSVYKASQDIYVNRDVQSYALDMAAVAHNPSIIVARTLLHLAVCINVLPPEFDPARISNLGSLEATTLVYVNTVTSLITSSDEKMLTLHGLEMLLLLAIYHINSGSFRQSWLIVRRGLSLAHLMGFQRIITQPDCKPPIPGSCSAKAIWTQLVNMDRYLGLHMRLPFGSEDYPLVDDTHLHLIYRSKVNAISRQIAELDRDVSPHSYARALSLDEELELIVKEVPKDFWDVPNISSTVRSPECFAVLEKLMVQLWHFEMKVFIHLPYLLRHHRDNRYAFSKATALQASRNIVMRWFALRSASMTQACCRFAEIGVFIAAVTLALDIVIELSTREKSEVKKSKGPDFAMICRLIGEMEALAKASEREKIAARSAIVLKKILSSLDPSRQDTGKARLTMPYFGTVLLEFTKVPVRPAFDLDSDTGSTMDEGRHFPVFSFVSNALWPTAAGDDGLDWDIVLFDGLEDRDVEGNWVF
ncbi:hypothetical protein P153DRAFT_356307 [Dothidotthia symphoricarpi CBS 119687]|uniref:Transcription factor domain-containing protein n=1 Tax=Dothidotthia symphoricarpi CBS 119687 TaxID=1392245 RepID=A0A6A6AF89_9PLEO|nr:uncharacterized protein P153DRAFT_356307 [Dothidotthia symphoricarpi CBS 119687]KAF2130569.1 hypothetical protein P153DRAFT_356307 [Dothidotthia symphoricarpi CBS 119687]